MTPAFMSSLLMTLMLFVQSTDIPLQDAEAEARARALMREIRCLVCQNQAIVESDAKIAYDLRVYVRSEVSKGTSNAVIKANLVNRYGDWVLLRPPFDIRTAFLWASPFLLLCFGLGAWIFGRRRAASTGAAQPKALSADEHAKLKALMGDDAP